jgi:site-specific DNA recombinase
MNQPRNGKRTPTIRCAIYTRKSTEEGLEQEFNSLHAQREAAEAFIKSQAHEGWVCLATHYDDGGFTGGNMERPALGRLLADIQAGRIEVVVTYKVDRLSRSLLDFARMMETFERHRISFVSVTQQFNTATSMGRLILNVLLSFAQFEREIISERTRDKIAAARRKGKWVGGQPLLGYDVDPRTFKLVVNDAEVTQVRAIFQLYLEHRGLIPVVQELDHRGWATKRWQTRKGRFLGGKPFKNTTLQRLLTNVAYIGRVKYRQESHPGEHAAIIDNKTWKQVQSMLRQNVRPRSAKQRSPSGAMLKGLLRCSACNYSMTPGTSAGRSCVYGYRYYTCVNASKRGARVCPTRSVSAEAIESFTWQHLQELAKTGHLKASTSLAQPFERVPVPERIAIVQALIERIAYDARAGKLAITLREQKTRVCNSRDPEAAS